MADATNPLIAALLREREGYARHGNTERVAQVDAQLAILGHKPRTAERTRPETASIEATETATIAPGRPRRSEPSE